MDEVVVRFSAWLTASCSRYCGRGCGCGGSGSGSGALGSDGSGRRWVVRDVDVDGR